MKTYWVPLGRIGDYAHPDPKCTAYQAGLGALTDYRFQVWTSRGAMLEAVRMSERGMGPHWKPLVKREA